jgi:hypothetical protein
VETTYARSPRGEAPHHFRVTLALALAASILLSLLPPGASVRAGGMAQQDLDGQATLETRQPLVQWLPEGVPDWQTVADRGPVRVGDRVRTGPGAAARLIYFEGTVTEVGAETSLLVQRLERSPNGNIVASLFQTVGTTVSRVVHLADPRASFEVETPSAAVFVRGTTPRVQVAPNGTTRAANIPDGTDSTVYVRGRDAARTLIALRPGQEAEVLPGQPPRLVSAVQGQATPGPAGMPPSLQPPPPPPPPPPVTSTPPTPCRPSLRERCGGLNPAPPTGCNSVTGAASVGRGCPQPDSGPRVTPSPLPGSGTDPKQPAGSRAVQ